MTIFISIAAYRDPDLVPTIHDCIAKATRPDELRVGICWQHGPEESIAPFDSDSRFRILDIDWRESQGACWARAECMKLWAGEDYFLQIDSHHRFVEGWDAILLRQIAATGSPKPVLTTYVTDFDARETMLPEGKPTRLVFTHFDARGVLLIRGRFILTPPRPIRARFLSGHFLFAPGSFVEEVPYDPDLYFLGEEITMAVRAFTHGYDLFHPSEHILWHQYHREGRTQHWVDHKNTSDKGRSVAFKDRDSRKKIAALFAEPWTGKYGFGIVRTLTEYEAYASVSFRDRLVHPVAIEGDEPPAAAIAPDWAEHVGRRALSLRLPHAAVPAPALADPLRWRVTLLNAEDEILFEQDFRRNELSALVTDDGANYVLPIEFPDYVQPVRWTVEPTSRSAGVLGKIVGTDNLTGADREVRSRAIDYTARVATARA